MSELDNETCAYLNDIHNFANRCEFVRNTSDCIFGDGHIEYIELIYCNAFGSYVYLALFLLLLWCLVLLLFLASVADDFFGPTLVVITKLLRLSENLAGVTLLALGNGAADIFSAIAGAKTSSEGDAGLVYGSLLGAGILVTTVTTGCVAIVKPFATQRRPIIKDIVFYIIAIVWNLSILCKGFIHFAEALGFIVLYLVYVALTVLSRTVRNRMLNVEKEKDKKKMKDIFGRPVAKPRRVSGLDPPHGVQLIGLRPLQAFDNAVYTPGPPESTLDTIAEEAQPSSVAASAAPAAPPTIHVEYDTSTGPVGGLRRVEGVVVRRGAPLDANSPHGKRSVSSYHGLTRKLTATRRTAGPKPSYLTRWVMAYRSSDDMLLPKEFAASGLMTRQRSISNMEIRYRSPTLEMPPARQRSQSFDHPAPRRRGVHGTSFTSGSSTELHAVTFDTGSQKGRTSTFGDAEFTEVPLPSPDEETGERTEPERRPEVVEKGEEEKEEEYVVPGFWLHFVQTINPLDVDEWREMGLFWKIFEIIRCPIRFILNLILPLVDEDHPTRGWCKLLVMLQCLLTPLFWLFALKALDARVAEVMPAWGISLIVGAILATVIFFTSTYTRPPRYHFVLAFVGFATAIIAIYTITNEVVNILPTYGAAFRIGKAILALTFLAWANSIGDIMSNTILAKNNFPRIAISACFGGPLFNLLLGIGIPFSMLTAGSPWQMEVHLTLVQLILFVFLLLTLISHLVLLVIFKFNIKRQYGIYFFILYCVFLVCAILAEQGIIPKPPFIKS